MGSKEVFRGGFCLERLLIVEGWKKGPGGGSKGLNVVQGELGSKPKPDAVPDLE